MSASFELPGVEMGDELLPRVSVAESLHRLTSVSTAEWRELPDGGHRLERCYPPMPHCEAVSTVSGGVLDTHFSTTGALERAVSQLVLMDAMQGYFDYELISMCGIPRVTLTGSAEDWRAIQTRARVFGEFELGWWLEALEPILDHFVAAAEGRVDVDHWSTIYKLKDDSGGPYLSGWFHVLFPYLRQRQSSGQTELVPNPHLKSWHAGMSVDFGGGPTTTELPGGVSRVPLRWRYLDQVLDMELLAGFVGIHQAPDSLELSPQLGWAVRERPL